MCLDEVEKAEVIVLADHVHIWLTAELDPNAKEKA